MEECGITSVKEFLRDWDLEDPLALDVYNQNLLAWFAFEDVAYSIQAWMEL